MRGYSAAQMLTDLVSVLESGYHVESGKCGLGDQSN